MKIEFKNICGFVLAALIICTVSLPFWLFREETRLFSEDAKKVAEDTVLDTSWEVME